MQAFLKEVVQLKDLDQKLPDFFPDYLEELVTVDEQEEKKDEQMMMRAGSGLVNCKDFGGAQRFHSLASLGLPKIRKQPFTIMTAIPSGRIDAAMSSEKEKKALNCAFCGDLKCA